MVDSNVAALTSASALSGPELFYAGQGGADRKVTATQIATFAALAASSGLTTVATLAALRALSVTDKAFVVSLGYWTSGDGGGGEWYYDATDSTTPEDYCINIVAAAGGRFKRIISGNSLDVRWFGARFNGTNTPLSTFFASLAAAQVYYPEAQALADELDGAALQRAINYCLYNTNAHWSGSATKFTKILLPAGQGFASRGIMVGYGQTFSTGSPYTTVTIEGQSEGNDKSSARQGGTYLSFSHEDGFLFGVQGSIGTTFREMSINGQYTYMLAGGSGGGFGLNGDLALSYWQDPAFNGGATNTFLMYCGICCDPIGSGQPVAWPTQLLPPEVGGGTYNVGLATSNSDGVHLYNVRVCNTYVGFGRVGGDGNGEWNTWEGENSGTSGVTFPVMNVASQSRQPSIVGCKFQNFYSAINGKNGYNPNIGNTQAEYSRIHFGFGIQLVDTAPGWSGPTVLRDCYAESVAMLGGGDLTLAGSYVSLREQDNSTGVPALHLTSGTLLVTELSNITTMNGLFVQGNVVVESGIIGTSQNRAVWSEGLARAGTATTIQLATTASAVDSTYNGMNIVIVTGTGSGQLRTVTGYVGATRTATVATWTTNPDTTSVYLLSPEASGSVQAIYQNSTCNVINYAGNTRQISSNTGQFEFDRSSWTNSLLLPNKTSAQSPSFYVHNGQTSSSSASYRTFSSQGQLQESASVPLNFDNAKVPLLFLNQTSFTFGVRNNRDFPMTRYSSGGVKADVGDVIGIGTSNPLVLLTWFVVIAADSTTMIVRQISNYYCNVGSGVFYAARTDTAAPVITNSTGYSSSIYFCSRVFDISMYGFVGATVSSPPKITGLKSQAVAGNVFNWPDKQFPFEVGDMLIRTDDSDAWANVAGNNYLTYWPVTVIDQATASMTVSNIGSFPTTGTVIRPKFGIKCFNA